MSANLRCTLPALASADRKLFDTLARRHNPVLDRAMPALSRAADHGVLWLAVAAVLAVSGRPPLRRAALRGMISLALASTTANGIAKLAVRRDRPPLDDIPAGRRVRRLPVTTSFPSGHTSSAAAFAVGAAREAPELAIPLGLLATGVGLSRVWTGAHYPGDVLVGAALGAAIAVVLPPERRTGAASSRGPSHTANPAGESGSFPS